MANKTFFGFAIADSMLPASCILRKSEIATHEIREMKDLVSCLNPSHAATIAAMRQRYTFDNVQIPDKAPQVVLSDGDKLIVMSVRGLPRLDASRHEYTKAEIDSATFAFSLYEVFGKGYCIE